MLNIDEVNATIEELENGATTLESCRKLAILYIVRENYKNTNLVVSRVSETAVVEEYKEILPTYQLFVDTKRRYQMHELPDVAVMDKLKLLCLEIKEFLLMLYNSLEKEEEREVMRECIASLSLIKNF